MAKVERLRPLLRKFEALERESRRKNNGSVVVGYAASYAIYVHENMNAKHGAAFDEGKGERKRDKQGKFLAGQSRKGSRGSNQQAKFLEKPFREKSREISTIVVTSVQRGVPLVKALILGGLFLQRESQKIVPVDTGNLKGSAFTEKE